MRPESPVADSTSAERQAGQKRFLLLGGLAVLLGGLTWVLAPLLLPVKLPDDFPKPPDLKSASAGLRGLLQDADKEARRRPGSAEAVGKLGVAYHANQFPEQAAAAYRIAARLASNDYQWTYAQAYLAEENGDSSNQVRLLQRTLKLKPDYAPALLKLADSYFKLDQLDQAAHYYEQASRLTDAGASLPAVFGLGRTAARRQEWSKVVEIAAPLSRSYPYLLPPYELLEEAYGKLGQKDKALEAKQAGAMTKWKVVPPPTDPFDDQLTAASFSSTRLLKQAGVLSRLAHPDRAVDVARRAAQADPTDPAIPNFLGHTLLTFFGDQPAAVDEAMKQLSACLRLRPDDLAPLWSFADDFFKSPKPRPAVERMRAFLQTYGERPEAQFYLAQAADELGQSAEAVAQYRAALKRTPTDSAIHNKLAQVLLKTGKTDEGVAEFQRAIQLNPMNMGARLNLGVALMQGGRYDRAIQELGELLRVSPLDAEAQFCMGYAYMYSKRVDEAIGRFREGLRLKPDDAEAHYGLGSAYLMQHKRGEALAEAREALRLRADFPAARELAEQAAR